MKKESVLVPTNHDMLTSCADAEFYCQQLELLIRGPEAGQDLDTIRRYFRGYLHCWKCVFYYAVRLEK